jgi:transcriptional regulator with XRE-family HTH domain
MPRPKGKMKFISRVPSLLGEKQTRENRIISQEEISEKTGLRRQTIRRWTRQGIELGNLDPDTVDAFLRYFDMTPDDLGKLVTIVPTVSMEGQGGK